MWLLALYSLTTNYLVATRWAARRPKRHSQAIARAWSPDDAHVFVVHGDICRINVDAVLIPTRNLNNKQWFPNGPPPGATAPGRDAFTSERRVMNVMASAARPGATQLWLAHLDGREAPPELRDDVLGRPRLEWFLTAAEQFLHFAHDDIVRNPRPPRNGRHKHLLAVPVVGTGLGGARGSSGEIMQQLLQLLHVFTATRNVDVVLVVNSGRMFSAAQAHRRQMAELDARWERSLGPRFNAQATRLARAGGAARGGMAADGAADGVGGAGETAGGEAAGGAGGDRGGSSEALQERLLQELVVAQMGGGDYSITHGLLAGLRLQAVVTTNYDTLFEAACAGAQVRINKLPYEAADAEHFVLKLHGDVDHPEDIVLTRSQMSDHRQARSALSGIVQSMLITKHLLFVGFSLQDPLFTELAGTVRTALSGGRAPGRTTRGEGGFGTLLTLRNRPFLSELWPDLVSMPMDLAAEPQKRQPRSACARRLEIFLDKVSLEASTCTHHLLDPNFGGVYAPEEQALKTQLLRFKERLQRNPAARRAAGYAVVRDTLRELGEGDPKQTEVEYSFRQANAPFDEWDGT